MMNKQKPIRIGYIGSVLLEEVVIIPRSRKASMTSAWRQIFLVAG